ncbi:MULTISPECIES: hypothetical protein [Rhodococcus erythropolis group]|jgi:Na+/proline symporter|uniref:Putative membrane protein n=1 Tax=Rhodococcus erythropolis TaxID=1833 RepID=A0A6G9D3U9_RHOER|nr:MULTISPECIES: hypothetical protein [Rhodococcus erythropolis group]MCT6736504.1 hypothetical protein [Rhodococcus qingshengii]MDJ0435058.1 hypothetical protein [Rhodococcus qingshengii]MDJ0490903.1 hypothetical protein [Rhodococcus qingshengii]QIP43907.1 putative membrane protein [Rhodococcus erythropolis]ULD44785.1 hypothetical protein JKI97_30460 [Rhodococcus qingshengii]
MTILTAVAILLLFGMLLLIILLDGSPLEEVILWAGWSVMVLALSFCVLGLFWGAVAAVGVVALAGGASYVYRYATFSRDRSLPNE